MRKDLLALGLIFCFVGLVFLSFSQMVVMPAPIKSWVTVAESNSEPTYNMSVQGSFINGSIFRVRFGLGPYSGPVPTDVFVQVNVTDPVGYTESVDVRVGRTSGGAVGIMDPFPVGTAFYTGIYRADAQAFFVSIIYLALEKEEITAVPPEYPYSGFLPVGGAVFAGGSGTLLLGARVSKPRKRLRKHK